MRTNPLDLSSIIQQRIQANQARRLVQPQRSLGNVGAVAKRAMDDDDDDDDDFAALVESISHSTGYSEARVVLALHKLFADVADLSEDGAQVSWTLDGTNAAEGVQLKATGGVTRTFSVLTGAGYFVENIELGIDGGGANDVVNATVTIEGHKPVKEKLVLGNGQRSVPFNKVLTSKVKVTISVPTATDNDPANALIAATGRMPTPEELRELARIMRPTGRRMHKLATPRKVGLALDALNQR